MAKAKTWKYFLIGLGVVVIIAVLIGITNLTRDVKQRQLSKHWLQKAEKSAGLTTTFEDAYRWLISHDFKVMVWNTHQDQGWIGFERKHTKDDETSHLYHIVQGSRLLTEKSFLSDASWIDLKFRFDSEQNFRNIEFVIRTYPFPKID